MQLCSSALKIPPWSRSEAEHEAVTDWLRSHSSRFFASLDNNPIVRDKYLRDIAENARLYSFKPGQVICLQNESFDNIFFLHKGVVKLHYMPLNKERRSCVTSSTVRYNSDTLR